MTGTANIKGTVPYPVCTPYSNGPCSIAPGGNDTRIFPGNPFNGYSQSILDGASPSAFSRYNRENFFFETNINEMMPTDMVLYWLSGRGGELHFPPESYISNDFKQGDGAKRLEYLFYDKFSGCPQDHDRIARVDYKYTWFWRAWNLNATVQIVGTWKGHAKRINDLIHFSAENDMTWNSLTFGRQRSESGYEWLNPDWLKSNTSDVHMIIDWVSPLKQCIK